ncbi:hypothetical protein AA0113_g3943 [Alternaria arborescens]|uniref:Uncharacterized protein n=1 Tax=Alternaria arborescens TaxID=156630 RepID=A0A4Q4SHP4_9PLEO|nr:hypothetical protein AA0111_g8522 [Alternaria arborescens]RYO26078.1 hypothetical protein AA0111_g8522 [Alternaria arborescens]RYO69559.1 hypothetical protein AA0113_g3943 [Alternaria arborescens]
MSTATTAFIPPQHVVSTSSEASANMPVVQETTSEESNKPTKPLSSHGLTLQVDFAWSKFRNIVASRGAGGELTPLYVQHFRPAKPQLRFERATDHMNIAKGTIHSFSISGDCIIHGREIILKPLKRWKTEYNYLSHALGGTPVSWIANSTLKVWDYVCINSATQEPIAKLSVNWWALKQVGNFYFDKTEEEVSESLRDEVVITGLTLLYVMTTRMNNPIHLLGAAFAKPGKVEGNEAQATVPQDVRETNGKLKST